jgi:hypothetical protein
MAPPPYAGCTRGNWKVSGGSHILEPGLYLGGIEASGGAKPIFEAGEYIIKGGPLKTSGGSTIEGKSVGFYLTGEGARVNVSGGGSIDLKAPSGGSMAGPVFFQGHDVNKGQTNKLSGDSSMYHEGVVYFPDREIQLTGHSSSTTSVPSTVFIAREIKVSGKATIAVNGEHSLSSVPVPLGIFRPVSKLAK